MGTIRGRFDGINVCGFEVLIQILENDFVLFRNPGSGSTTCRRS